MLTVHGDGAGSEETVDTVKNLEYASSTFVHSFLANEGAAYEVRHISVKGLDEEALDDVLEQVRRYRPTIFSYSDGKIKLIRVEGRAFLSLESARITREGAKLMKRLGMFFTRTYLHGVFSPDEITVQYVTVPEEARIYHDGRIFISGSLVDRMIDAAVERGADRDSLNQTVFNIRGILPGCMLKGDAVRVNDLEADLVIVDPDDNLKGEIVGIHDTVFLHLTPHHQWGSVRLDRQTLSTLGSWLFPEGFLEDALREKFDAAIDKVVNGQPIFIPREDRPENEEDAISTMEQRMTQFYEVVRNLNESLHLTQRNAQRFYKSETSVTGDDLVKRYPVPFTVRMYLRNSVDYATVYGIDPVIGANEVLMTPFGVVLPDVLKLNGEIRNDGIALQLHAHGGGDWDDNAMMAIRVAEDHDEFFDIAPGDVVTINIRQPIGVQSDGEHLYVEFTVMKIAESSIQGILGHFGLSSVDELPKIRMADRPKSVLEFPDLEPQWVPSGDGDDTELTLDSMFNDCKLIVLREGGYGIHANQMMAAARLGVAFEFFTHEENWIDTYTTGTSEDRDVLDEQAELMRSVLEDAPVTFDRYEARRLGFYDYESQTYTVAVEDGIFTQLVDNHRAEIRRYSERVSEHIKNLVILHKERAQMMVDSDSIARDFALTSSGSRMQRGLGRIPGVLARLYTEENRYRHQHGLDMLEYYQADGDNDVADLVVRRMGQSVREGRMEPEEARAFIMHAFLYHHEAAVEISVSRQQPGKVYSYGDRLMYSGLMFTKLLAVIQEALDNNAFISIGSMMPDDETDVII